MFLSLQQRTHADDRTDEAHDIRNHSKFKLRICTDLKPQSELRADPEFNAFPHPFQYEIWPVIRSDFPPDSIPHSSLYTWFPNRISSKFQFRSRHKCIANPEVDADPKAPSKVFFIGSELNGRGNQHEICSGSFELG